LVWNLEMRFWHAILKWDFDLQNKWAGMTTTTNNLSIRLDIRWNEWRSTVDNRMGKLTWAHTCVQAALHSVAAHRLSCVVSRPLISSDSQRRSSCAPRPRLCCTSCTCPRAQGEVQASTGSAMGQARLGRMGMRRGRGSPWRPSLWVHFSSSYTLFHPPGGRMCDSRTNCEIYKRWQSLASMQGCMRTEIV